MKKRVLITGGAGYLGSCAAEWLAAAGWEPVLVDDFSSSRREDAPPFPLEEVDLKDHAKTLAVFQKFGPLQGVLHFAAHTLIGESMQQPQRYLRNNYLAALNVADAANTLGVQAVVHSSSCAVYGAPSFTPMDEQAKFAPLSPYGASKVAAEQAFLSYRNSARLRVVNLRYFNPAGSLLGVRGERHVPETHLLPNVVSSLLDGRPLSIFGEDYPSRDGTCIRDFIHVEDLMEAHRLALEKMLTATQLAQIPEAVNVGTGHGHSVREVIETASRVLQLPAKIQSEARRPGDPPVLVADNALLKQWLGFRPSKTLEAMVESHAKFLRADADAPRRATR